MEASRAHAEGKPFLSDEQYDDLKRQLRRDRSTVVAQASSFPCRTLCHVGHVPAGMSRQSLRCGWALVAQ